MVKRSKKILPYDPKDWFCVIGPNSTKVDVHINRSWYNTKAEAIKHANSIMGKSGKKMLVVQVVAVVEQPVPVANVREPVPSDFEFKASQQTDGWVPPTKEIGESTVQYALRLNQDRKEFNRRKREIQDMIPF